MNRYYKTYTEQEASPRGGVDSIKELSPRLQESREYYNFTTGEMRKTSGRLIGFIETEEMKISELNEMKAALEIIANILSECA